MTITASTLLKTKYGVFVVRYHSIDNTSCISFSMGDIENSVPIVRLQSSCLFSESFHAIDCDCNLQLGKSIELIAQEQCGVIIYKYEEGRGVGLENKIKALELERVNKLDTVDAFKKLHFKLDGRKFKTAVTALKELNLNRQIRLITNNPRKKLQLESEGFEIVEEVKLKYPVNQYVKKYLNVVKKKLGHQITSELLS